MMIIASNHRTYLLSVPLVSLLWTVVHVDGAAFRFICSPDSQVVTLYRDATTGQYVDERPSFVEDDDEHVHRNLRTSSTQELQSSLLGHEFVGNWFQWWNSIDWEDEDDAFVAWEEPLDVAERTERTNSSSHHGRQLHADIVAARRCTCGPFRTSSGWNGRETVYCPLTTSHCGTYRNPDFHEPRNVGCLTPPENERFHNILFLVIILWCAVVAFCLFSSRRGRHLVNCLLSQCMPGYLRFVANRMMRHEPELAREMMVRNLTIRIQLMHQQGLDSIGPDLLGGIPADENGPNNTNNNVTIVQTNTPTGRQEENKPPPRSLALKTRIYRSTNDPGCTVVPDTLEKDGLEDDDDDDLETMCIICFQAIQDGERVGVLPCTHVFHVDCLKTWLRRRNVCPMCNISDVAEPQYDEDDRVEPVPPQTEATTTAEEEETTNSSPLSSPEPPLEALEAEVPTSATTPNSNLP